MAQHVNVKKKGTRQHQINHHIAKIWKWLNNKKTDVRNENKILG